MVRFLGVCISFPFDDVGGLWNFIVSVSDHCPFIPVSNTKSGNINFSTGCGMKTIDILTTLSGCTKFNRPDKLKSNIIIHSGMKPFRCFYLWQRFMSPHRKESWTWCFGADPIGVGISVGSGVTLTYKFARYLMNRFSPNLHGYNIGTWWRAG